MNLTRYMLDNHVAALVAVLLVILFGAVSLFRLPIQLTPEVERPTITIDTSWRAAAPEEVEAAVSAGADAIGFVFYERSPRNVAPSRASESTCGVLRFVLPLRLRSPHP